MEFYLKNEIMEIKLYCGNCLDILPFISDKSVNAVFSDPPYPEIKRDYGKISVDDWMLLMQSVVKESKRIVKDTGSAVFILQANSSKIGVTRTWLWEFLVWAANEWSLIQDVYWHNTAAMPNRHCNRQYGLMRPSVKMCIWLGSSDAYRNQDEILKTPCQAPKHSSNKIIYSPSGYNIRHDRAYATPLNRGGATPFNLIQMPNTSHKHFAAGVGHGAGTPYKLTDWWIRYICPPGGLVLDPFSGVATTGLVCKERGRSYIGIEKKPEYHSIAAERLQEKEETT